MNIKTALFVCTPLLLLSCGHTKSKQVAEITTAEVATEYLYGTYEGVLEGDNNSSQYILLSLDSLGKFELYKKEIGVLGTNVSKGTVISHITNDTVNLQLGEELAVIVQGNTLSNNTLQLKYISDAQQINPAYYNFTIKENKSGDNYIVTIYSEEGIEYAELNFQDKKFKLTANTENSQELEYTNGTEQLLWNIIDPAPLANYQPTFSDGKQTYSFTHLGPTNLFYKAKGASAPVNQLDVLYFNPEEGSFVKILSNNQAYCYELKQTEASSKTGNYESAEIKWYANNKNEASLVIKDSSYVYVDTTR